MTKHPTIFERVRAERTRRHLSPAKVAEMAGVARNTVDAVESGKGNVQNVLRVASALGLELRAVKVQRRQDQ